MLGVKVGLRFECLPNHLLPGRQWFIISQSLTFESCILFITLSVSSNFLLALLKILMIVVSLFERCDIVLAFIGTCTLGGKVLHELVSNLIHSLEVFVPSHSKVVEAEALVLAVSNLWLLLIFGFKSAYVLLRSEIISGLRLAKVLWVVLLHCGSIPHNDLVAAPFKVIKYLICLVMAHSIL